MAALDPTTFVTLADAMEFRVFRDGERLLSAHSLDRDMLILLQGEAEVWIRRDARRVKVATLGPGQVIGEISFFNQDHPRTADVVARREGAVAVLGVEAWKRLETSCPDAVKAVQRQVLYELISRVYVVSRTLARAAPVVPVVHSVKMDLVSWRHFERLAPAEPLRAGDIVLPVTPRLTHVAVVGPGIYVLERPGPPSPGMVFAEGPAVLGWGAAIAGEPTFLQVRCEKDSTICRVPAEQFREAFFADGERGRAMRRAMVVHASLQLAALNGALLATTVDAGTVAAL